MRADFVAGGRTVMLRTTAVPATRLLGNGGVSERPKEAALKAARCQKPRGFKSLRLRQKSSFRAGRLFAPDELPVEGVAADVHESHGQEPAQRRRAEHRGQVKLPS